MLLALNDGGMPFATSPNRGWQSIEAESLFPDYDIGCKDDANVLKTVLPADVESITADQT